MLDFDPGAAPSSRFDKGPPAAVARHFAALPSIPIEHRALFWYDWGPVFYRGRLDGTAKVLAIASDPGPTERLVGRTLVGDAGQRVQGFLAKLGLRRSYVLVNAFPLAVHPSKSNKAKPLLSDPAQLAWRNRFYDMVTDSRLEAILAFGGNAQAALRLWAAPQVPTFEVPHPSSHDAAGLAAKWAAAIPAARAAVTPDDGGDQNGPNYGSRGHRGRLRAHPARRPPVRRARLDRGRPLGAHRHSTSQQHGREVLGRPGPRHGLASAEEPVARCSRGRVDPGPTDQGQRRVGPGSGRRFDSSCGRSQAMPKTTPPGEVELDHGTFQANVQPDVFDARDLEYRPRLQVIPQEVDWRAKDRYVMKQDGNSCTGHAVAAMVNAILAQQVDPTHVSPYMLYALARRYDEFEGEADVGSSLRGALKGWYYHGVLPDTEWPTTRPGARSRTST